MNSNSNPLSGAKKAPAEEPTEEDPSLPDKKGQSSFLEGDESNVKVWSLKTDNGEYMAIDFYKGLKEVAAKPASMVSEVVSAAMKKYGVTHADNETVTTTEEQDDDKVAQDPDVGGGKEDDTRDFSFGEAGKIEVLPIEDRDIFRGGMTAERSLQMVIKDPQRFISGNWGPSSFVEMGPGGFEPMGFMRQPESLMQLGRPGPSGKKGVAEETLLQVDRKRSADSMIQAFRRQGPSSLLEIGPGGMA